MSAPESAEGTTPNAEAVRREWEYFNGVVKRAADAASQSSSLPSYAEQADARSNGIRDALAWVLGERTETLR